MSLVTKEERINNLVKFLGIEKEDITQTYGNVFEIIGENEHSGEEYLVLDEPEAYEEAKDYITSTIDDMGLESFTPTFKQWILDYALNDSLLEDMVRDDIENYYENMYSDELVEEAIENDLITENQAYEDVYDEDGKLIERTFSDDLDLDQLRDDLIDERFNEISDYSGYLIDMYGEDMFEKIVIENKLLDIDYIVDECISVDGLAHFLASYDGELNELEDDLFAFRIN